MAERDSAFGEIVGGEFQSDFVAGKDANAIAAKAASQVRQHHALVFELHAKQAAGEFF